MNRYGVAILWSVEDQAFVAQVPELPGCVAHGDTHEAALAAAKDAITLWLETARAAGREVPPSRSFVVDLPVDAPLGLAKIHVRFVDEVTAPAPAPRFANLTEYTAWLLTQPPTGRTAEEIDRHIQEERGSWE